MDQSGPSNRYTAAPYPSQRSRASSTIRSNTGCGSPGEGRNHLQHIGRSRPDARSARDRCCAAPVACAQSPRPAWRLLRQRRVTLSPQFRVGTPKFGDRVGFCRGHWPSPRRAPCRSAIACIWPVSKSWPCFPPAGPNRDMWLPAGSDAQPSQRLDPQTDLPPRSSAVNGRSGSDRCHDAIRTQMGASACRFSKLAVPLSASSRPRRSFRGASPTLRC